MADQQDPYRYHPGLRGKITDPEASFFRDFSVENLLPILEERGLPRDWWYPDAVREGIRANTLANRPTGDLWVFAYGSLMWDPAFHFTEVRRATLEGYARRFILIERNGGRGSPESPGVMAALDRGPCCNGLLFRIAEEAIETETEILFRRECVTPGYLPTFLPVETAQGVVPGLCFLADHDAEIIDAGVSRATQVRLIATSEGFLGTSYDYLANIAEQFAALKIEDAEVTALLAEVEAYRGRVKA